MCPGPLVHSRQTFDVGRPVHLGDGRLSLGSCVTRGTWERQWSVRRRHCYHLCSFASVSSPSRSSVMPQTTSPASGSRDYDFPKRICVGGLGERRFGPRIRRGVCPDSRLGGGVGLGIPWRGTDSPARNLRGRGRGGRTWGGSPQSLRLGDDSRRPVRYRLHTLNVCNVRPEDRVSTCVVHVASPVVPGPGVAVGSQERVGSCLFGEGKETFGSESGGGCC